MMFTTIIYEEKEKVAWIQLNRPNTLNSFTAQMNNEITNAVKKAAENDQIRCLIITGIGKAFSSGQDLSEVDEKMDHGQVLKDHYGPMIREIENCKKPIIAAVNGIAAGAGFSLALACDFRLLSEKASFLNAFIHVGLIPDSGNLYYLQQMLGYAKALELSILGEKITAEQALDLQLANKVISKANWQEEVEQFALNIADRPTKAISLIKECLKHATLTTFEDYLEKEAEGQRIAGLTQDHREGVNAFKEKRKPVFIGK